MREQHKCPICGKPTSSYFGTYREDGLCREHKDMLTQGLIEQCPDCQKWHETGAVCECKTVKANKTVKESRCVVCGAPSNGKPQCKSCYYETREHMGELDKNRSVRKLRDHYYNLKERIFIIKSLEETQIQCNRLIAIALTAEEIAEDSSLIDRVYTDVEGLIKNKQTPTQNTKIEEEKKERDEQKSKINTAQDGHNVDSDMEVKIDDILYNAFILHCYGKNIDEILEKRKKCDWFIPIANGKGIYIEYWGMKTPKYLEERKEKESLYKKYNIPYISIEQDDPKHDTQTFKSNLLRDLTTLAIERFGFMPEWKK